MPAWALGPSVFPRRQWREIAQGACPWGYSVTVDLQSSVASQLLPNLVEGATPVHYWNFVKTHPPPS